MEAGVSWFLMVERNDGFPHPSGFQSRHSLPGPPQAGAHGRQTSGADPGKASRGGQGGISTR